MVRLKKNAPFGRDALMQALFDRGVSTRRGVMAIHRELPYRDHAWEERLPETNAAAEETIILPLYTEMTDDDHEYVIESLREICAVQKYPERVQALKK
jgi:dTDP-4-amino-4,6-dideoxygalactose transaminase